MEDQNLDQSTTSTHLITEVTDATWEQEVIQSSLPVIVDFWAEWCGPCYRLAPILESMAVKYQGKLRIVKLDVDRNIQASQRYSIMSLPTMMLFVGGMAKAQAAGAMPEEAIMSWLTPALAESGISL